MGMRSSIVAGICLLMAASSVTADYYLSANQIFCNCGSTEAAFYQTYTESENACIGQTHERYRRLAMGWSLSLPELGRYRWGSLAMRQKLHDWKLHAKGFGYFPMQCLKNLNNHR